MDKEKGILTIATGKKIYVDMACNLARSFLLWNKGGSIRFQLVTDLPEFVPSTLKKEIDLIFIEPGAVGPGFTSKLKMAELTLTAKTLFIDADCLIYGDLEKVFEKFGGHDFSVIGHLIYSGKKKGFCEDVEDILRRQEIPYFPLLCGSVYYLEKGPVTKNIFNYANDLVREYDNLGLIRLRNRENEEPLLAISMAKYKQTPIQDDGSVKADRMFYEFLRSNVLQGTARLWNQSTTPFPDYSQRRDSEPLIVHFNDTAANSYEYRSEIIRLGMAERKWNKSLIDLYVNLTCILPGRMKLNLKSFLRPFYRSLFGIRNIKLSERIIQN